MKAFFVATSVQEDDSSDFEHGLMIFRHQHDRDWTAELRADDGFLLSADEAEIGEDWDLTALRYVILLTEGQNGPAHHVRLCQTSSAIPEAQHDLERLAAANGEKVLSSRHGETPLLDDEDNPEQPMFDQD